MRVNLIGLGSGAEENLTAEAREALEQAELVLGAERLLRVLPAAEGQTRVAAVRPAE
ncbi:MAG: SAM-dependent methyltransferase, partial [Candidatus Limivicinus sp.]